MNNISTPPSQLPVNIGESLLAVIGLMPFIRNEPVRVRVPEMSDALGMSRTIAKLAKSLVNGGETMPVPETDMPYMKLLDRFAEGLSQDVIQQAITAVQDGQGGMELSRVLQTTWDFLTVAAPRVLFDSQVATVNLDPDVSSVWDWTDQVALLSEPLGLFGKVQDGSALPSDIDMMDHCYPTILKSIRLAVDNAINDGLADRKSFSLPAYCEFGVATLRGKPIKAAPYQDAYVITGNSRDAQPTPGQAAKSPLAAEAASPVESSLYRPPGTK